MMFKDEKHKQFYNDCIKKDGVKKDPFRQSFFYIIGLAVDTRKSIDSFYDFKKRCIRFEGLSAPWQSSGTIKVTRLAYNLYNGFSGDTGDGTKENADLYTPYELFDSELLMYMFEGIKLRYPEHRQSSD